MREMWLVLAVAAATYLTRIAGFSLGRRHIPPAMDRFLSYVPIAAFATLIVPGLDGGGTDIVPQFVGLTAAALTVLRWHALWAGLATGMAGFWLMSLLLTSGVG